jgi:hypothetical protein
VYKIPQILVSFSSLENCTIPTVLNYKPKSKYLKEDLPCKPGNEKVLELRLLSGDLDDPSAKSESTDKVLKEFENSDGLSFANPIFLLAGHGFGKTKTIFDVAGERFTILLDASEEKLVADIRAMISEVDQHVHATSKKNKPESQKELEDLCAFEVLLTAAARLTVLQLLLALEIIKTPKDWLNLQLNGLLSSYIFLEVFSWS